MKRATSNPVTRNPSPRPDEVRALIEAMNDDHPHFAARLGQVIVPGTVDRRLGVGGTGVWLARCARRGSAAYGSA